MTVRSPEERAAAAQKLRDKGDNRPLSQIEGEMLAQEQQDVANKDNDKNPSVSDTSGGKDGE